MEIDHEQEERFKVSLGEIQNAMENPQTLIGTSSYFKISEQASNRIREINDRMDAIAIENGKRHQAILGTAENTKEINNKINSINDSLDKERDERISSDQENFRYTQKWNKINLLVAAVGALAGLAGLIAAILK